MKALSLISIPAVFVLADSSLLEIYKNRAFFHQNLSDAKSSFSIEVPNTINIRDIDISASCEVQNLTLNDAEFVKDDEYSLHEELSKRIKNLNNKLSALNSKSNFLSHFTPSDKMTADSLKDESDKLYEVVLKNLDEISDTQKELEKLNLELNKFKVKQVKKLDLRFECEPKFVKISYPVNIKLDLQNEISADTSKSQVDIIQGLSLTSPFVKDIKNLDIALYPFSYSSNLIPPHFYPWYEGKPEPRPVNSTAAPIMEMADTASIKMRSAKMTSSEVSGQNVQNTLSNSWRISNVNLKAGEDNKFVYDRQNVKAKFEIVIDGYSGSNGYIKAIFTPIKSMEYASTAMKIDGISVGKSSSFSLKPNEENFVYFGKNDLISVKKESLVNFTKESFFGNKKKISTGFSYEIKNGSDKPWDITLIEKVPVSTHESISVAVKNTPKESEISKQGEVSWKFELKPNENKKVEFTYELTKPTNN